MIKKNILWIMIIIFLLNTYNTVATITGGNITYDGEYTIHTFYTNGTFTVDATTGVAILVVGGGGGGGMGNSGGGGGGAGGLMYNSSISLLTGTYTVVIGSGGLDATNTANAETSRGKDGGNSQLFNTTLSVNFSTIGGGGGGGVISYLNGRNGGSGGGGSNYAGTGAPGTGVVDQGYAGGFGVGGAPNYGSAGGGGAGGLGYNGTATDGGDGGIGRNFSINGTNTYYAGGGGGSVYGGTDANGGTGGLGGGGAGGKTTSYGGTNGTGGGSGGTGAGTTPPGHIGGSGIVIIRYKPTADSINFTSYAPANNTVAVNNTPTFSINISSMSGAWNISLIVNGTLIESQLIAIVGIYDITPKTPLSMGTSAWWFNGTGTGVSYVTESRNIFISGTINLTAYAPINNSYTYSTTPTFYGNITNITGVWNISLVVNGTIQNNMLIPISNLFATPINDLLAYWNMNQNGQLIDSLGILNSTSNNGSIIVGKINYSQYYMPCTSEFPSGVCNTSSFINGTDFSNDSRLIMDCSENITLSAWINPIRNTNGDIIVMGDTSLDIDSRHPNRMNYGIGIFNNRFVWTIYNGSLDQLYNTTYEVNSSLNSFTHVLVTHTFCNGTTTKMYINGTLYTGAWLYGDGNSVWTNASSAIHFGTRTRGYTGIRFNGSIDEVGIWNRTLSSTEIMQLYSFTTTSTTGTFSMIPSTLFQGSEYSWWFNATDTTNINNTYITAPRNIYIINTAGGTGLSCLTIPGTCSITTANGCNYIG